MSVTFANVTDIKIPEGNVTKITETNTGHVLWEKKRPLSAHWEYTYFTDAENSKHYAFQRMVENGNNLIFLGDNYLQPFRFTYNPINGNITEMYRMDNNEIFDYEEAKARLQDPNDTTIQAEVHSADIDPLSKIWCAVGGNYYFCSSDMKMNMNIGRVRGGFLCCWSDTLKQFCICGRRGSFLVNTKGQITAESSITTFLPVVLDTYYSIAWSNKKQIFLVTMGREKVAKSTDGISWNIYTPDLTNLPEAAEKTLTGVSWIPMLNAFIATAYYDGYTYVYISQNGENWQYKSKFQTLIDNANPTYSLGVGILQSGYLPDKNLILMISPIRSYISANGEDWIEIRYGLDYGSDAVRFFWSETLKTAVLRPPLAEGRGYGAWGKLVID